MNCAREEELLDALTRGYIGPELEAHIAACASCKELQVVAGAVLDDRANAVAAAPIPSSATMLWRMKTRHRQDLADQARRTLLFGQAATLLVAVTLVLAFFGRNVASSVHAAWSHMPPLSLPLVCALAFWIVAAPIAGWVVARGK